MSSIDLSLKQAIYNDLKLWVPSIAGLAVSALVTKVGHSIFKCDEKSNGSNGIKLTAFVAGTAAGIYASSFFPLYAFTAVVALKVGALFLAVSIVVTVVAKIFGMNSVNIPVIGIHGTLGALFPRAYPVLCALQYAMIGCNQTDQPAAPATPQPAQGATETTA